MKGVNMKVILAILIIVFLFWLVYWRYDYAKDYPQCLLSKDVVTCVEIMRLNYEK